MLTDNSAFHNVLASMRPKLMTTDFPSSYNVKVHLYNEFVQHMKGLKEAIMVSASGKCVITSVCKSSLRTGKRLQLDWTGLEKNQTAVLVFDI